MKRAAAAQGKPARRRAAVPVALWLLLMLVALSLVVWRQTRGVAVERELRALETDRAVAEAERLELVRRVHQLGSRARIVRVARERLGMRLPGDGEIVFLAVPAETVSDTLIPEDR